MKTEGRQKIEKAIMNKIQSIFDNANLIDGFELTLKGGVGEITTIEYKVAERIIPEFEEREGETE